MYCPNCGVQADDETANFCPVCGATFAEQGQAASVNNGLMKQQQSGGSVSSNSNGTVFKVLGWVFFGISLLFIPILFGAGSFIMGYLLRKNHHDTHGTILMVMGIAGAILGALIGMAMAPY